MVASDFWGAHAPSRAGFGCQCWGICEMPPGLIDQLMEKLGSDFEY